MRASGLLVAALGVAVAAPAGAYVRSRGADGVPLEWNRRCIPFHIHEAGSDDVPFDQVEDAVLRSFDAWEDVECSDLEFHYQGTTAVDSVGADFVNLIIWRETDEAWEHAAGVIALTTTTFCQRAEGEGCDKAGQILDADIELNGAEFTFSHTREPGRIRFDLRNTLTHEIGHFVGLDHTTVPEATMYASAPPGEISKATLHDDDIQGMCDVYPGGPEPTACEPFERPLVGGVGGSGSALDEPSCACGAASAAPAGSLAPLLLLGLAGLRRRRPRP